MYAPVAANFFFFFLGDGSNEDPWSDQLYTK